VTRLPEFLFIRMVWDRTGWPQPRIVGSRPFDLHYGPEPDYPFGRRGKAMAGAWEQLSTTDTRGMLVQDGDVLIDPHDFMMMLSAIVTEPGAVHVAPVKIWPASKAELPGWQWAHWKGHGSQEIEYEPDFFCFNFTYIPRALIERCIRDGLKTWRFPGVDTRVARACRAANIPIRVVKDCAPKHMHF